MQVYLLKDDKNPEAPIEEYSAFRNFSDIKPSLQISYSACKDVQIEMKPKATGGPTFIITGSRDGQRFADFFTTVRLSVWDSPTHI